MGLSIWELLIILVIVALLFGTKKLRSIGGDLGNAVKGFRSAIKEDDDGGNKGEETNDQKSSIIEGETDTRKQKTTDNDSPG